MASYGNDPIESDSQEKPLVALEMSDLPSLARSLHSSRKLKPAQIRNRTGFLDSNDRPFIPTIHSPRNDPRMVSRHSSTSPAERSSTASSISNQPRPVLMAAMPPPETWFLDPAGQDIVAQHLRRQAEEISRATDQAAVRRGARGVAPLAD